MDIDEDRRRPEPSDDLGGRREREGRAEDGVARPQPFGHENQRQRVRAVGAGDHVRCAAEGREVGFQLRHLRSHDVAAMVDDPQDRLVDARAKPAALGCEIDKWKSVGHGKAPRFNRLPRSGLARSRRA
jgi:hypothetical protein